MAVNTINPNEVDAMLADAMTNLDAVQARHSCSYTPCLTCAVYLRDRIWLRTADARAVYAQEIWNNRVIAWAESVEP